jgi:DNA-binding NtrC family response regulator
VDCVSESADDAPTLDAQPELQCASGLRVPTLTLLAHPELHRVGERAALHALLVRRPVLVSRTLTAFGKSHEASRALLDVSISRRPVLLSLAEDGASILLDPAGTDLRVDGLVAQRPMLIAAEHLTRGVSLRLSSRVALLLHLQSENTEPPQRSRLVGTSPAMSSLRTAIAHAARSSASVLILGESGTGKELVAEAIHRQSARAEGPWIALNMATLNENTAYSHLFGHRKGSFTGAEAAHTGLFESAHGGCLLLDELADATPRVQAMLLRTLESSRILPMGASTERPVDVRVIAATERDLVSETAQGSFRASLGQRLAALVIRVPPLRERREDIPGLLVHFLASLDPSRSQRWFSPAEAHSAPGLSADFMLKLMSHPFPGNVRELRNIAAQLLASGHAPEQLPFELAANETSHPVHGPASLAGIASAPASHAVTPAVRRAPSDEELRHALIMSDWSPAAAARLLGVPNSSVHYWIKNKGIVRRAFEYSDSELQSAADELGGNLDEMSKALSISVRGLRLRLKRSPVELPSAKSKA